MYIYILYKKKTHTLITTWLLSNSLKSRFTEQLFHQTQLVPFVYTFSREITAKSVYYIILMIFSKSILYEILHIRRLLNGTNLRIGYYRQYNTVLKMFMSYLYLRLYLDPVLCLWRYLKVFFSQIERESF